LTSLANPLRAALKIVDRTASEQPVPHVQSLRDIVEGEDDERLGCRVAFLGLLKRF
jgi:hypothetical protein